MTLNPDAISRFKKERFLKSLSEDDFRDQVVRPLLHRLGYGDGRDLCGPTEEGKDSLFTYADPLRKDNLCAVQTKKGKVDLSAKNETNILNVLTQLSTALGTSYQLLNPPRREKPSKVILCASGEIGQNARRHIAETTGDPRLSFLDSDDLIPLIDRVMSELWYGIDTNRTPYLTKLIESLTAEPNADPSSPASILETPVTAERYAPLKVHRIAIGDGPTRGGKRNQDPFEELPITSLLRRRERLILVLGEAGSGKTQSMRRIACIAAEEALESATPARIPIIVKAAEILAGGNDLVAVLAQKTLDVSHAPTPAFSAQDAQQGHVLILIDGLDEIPSHNDRQAVLNSVTQVAGTYPRIQIILASRRYPWLTQLEGIEAFTWFFVSHIDWKETKAIVARIKKGKGLSESKTKEILRRLDDVHGMQLNPLLVTVFVASSEHTRADIPANITELFKKFTELMLGRWDESKGFSEQYQAPLKDFLLRQLAVHMHRNRRTSMSLGDVRTFVEARLLERGKVSDLESLLHELVHRSGLFRLLGDDVEFAHMLLQEFFAGRGLEETEVVTHLRDDWWQRAIVFFFGDSADRSQLITRMVGELEALGGRPLVTSSVTLGLALQACYLIKLDDKVGPYSAIVRSLARATLEAFDEDTAIEKPLLNFVGLYLYGRDAVCCDVVSSRQGDIVSHVGASGDPATSDAKEFWQIVGLMECGHIEEAYERIRAFHPSDRRLLLALHLGASVLEHVRAVDKESRRRARMITSHLAPKTSELRLAVFEEFKSELLELRHGKVEALPAGEAEDA